jgi:hypothetical protein
MGLLRNPLLDRCPCRRRRPAYVSEARAEGHGRRQTRRTLSTQEQRTQGHKGWSVIERRGVKDQDGEGS